MSSFFTIPKSQKKRKRSEKATEPSSKRSKSADVTAKKSRAARDESISGSEAEDVSAHRGIEGDDGAESSEDEETAAERRLRLAEQYLEKIKGDVQDDDGFDAKDIDRDLIAERLQEDVSETKGRLYKHIASDFDFINATHTRFRTKASSIYSVAVSPPYAYTVTRDAVVTKWQIHTPPLSFTHPRGKPRKPQKPIRRRPTKIAEVNASFSSRDILHHTAPILAIAASSDGKYIVTGSADKKLILYSTSSPSELTPLKVFPQHRDAVTSLCFRPGTNQFFSSSRDRTVKVWSADERAYVETLFGHQDEVTDIAAFPTVERCVSVGARDRTARVWKVVEETQLVFRGGGSGGAGKKDQRNGASGVEEKKYVDGSIDKVAVIDNDTFVTGSDNGSLCLWSLHKKKPVYTYPLAHGLEPQMTAEKFSAEMHLGPDLKLPERQPRWITALKAIPLSDLIVTGSWDGSVRVWEVGDGKRTLNFLGVIGQLDGHGEGESASIPGVINDIDIFERGEKGKEGLCIVAAIGKEHRLGKWMKIGSRGGAMIWEVPKKRPAKAANTASEHIPIRNGIEGEAMII